MLTLSLSDKAEKAPSKKVKIKTTKKEQGRKNSKQNETKHNIEKTKQSNNKNMKTENVKLIVEEKTWLNITTWISYKGMNRCNGSYIIIKNIHICILYYYY